MSIRTARALRKRSTPQEAKLWLRLRALRPQGFHFRRQVPIGSFVVDFACLKAWLVIEVDGGQHGADLHLARDCSRDEALALAGFRFWNAEVDADPDAVADTIFARLTDGRPLAFRQRLRLQPRAFRAIPHPSPPLRGGR